MEGRSGILKVAETGRMGHFLNQHCIIFCKDWWEAQQKGREPGVQGTGRGGGGGDSDALSPTTPPDITPPLLSTPSELHFLMVTI